MLDLKHDIKGEDVIENLSKIYTKCETISSDLYLVLKQARHSCPRLHLLTDAHIIEYLSIAADPKDVISDLSWVFSGVKQLKIDQPPKQSFTIDGVKNTSHENLDFLRKVFIDPQEKDGSNFFLCSLLNDIEKEIKQSLKDNLTRAMPLVFRNGYNYRNNFKYVKENSFLYQILVLLNNILFYHDLTMIIAGKEHTNDNIRETFVRNKLNMFKQNIEHNLGVLCESLVYEKEKRWFLLLNQFIFYIKYQLDILTNIIEADVQSLDTFEYLVLPKTMIEYNAKAIKDPDFLEHSVVSSMNFLEETSKVQDLNKLNGKSNYLHLYKSIDPGNYTIIVRSFDYKRNYGFDLIPNSEPTVLTPSTNRSYVTMLGALATQTGILVNGPQDRGKKETIKV